MERFLEGNEDEEWENDFVFDEGEDQEDYQGEGDEENKYYSGSELEDDSFGEDDDYKHPLQFGLRKSEDSGDSNDLNTFLRQDIHQALQINPVMHDLDIIPNVGMDGLFSDEALDNEEPLLFDGFDAPDEPDAFQIMKEEAAAARRAAQKNQAKSQEDQLGIIASSSSSDAHQYQKQQPPASFLREHSSDVKTTVSNVYSESSNNDKTTFVGGAALSRDVTISDVDDDEEGDWDTEFILNKPEFVATTRSHKTLALAGMRAQPKNPEPIALSMAASTDKQEPLLEHLDTCLKKRFQQVASSVDNQEEAFRANFNDEEYKGQDSQHLKDLPLWILSTSARLSSYLSDGGSKCSLAAVEAELRSMNSDPYFVEQLLERCEEDVTKDSTVFSLEIAVKWIQATCLLMDKNKALIQEDRLGKIFYRCEHLLGEASRSNLEKIVEYDNVLSFELSYIYEPLDAVPLLMNRSSVISSAVSCLTNQLSLARLNVYMLQVKAHSKCVLETESHLEQLEMLWDELEMLRTRWLANLMLFLPHESPWTTPRERRQNSFSPIGNSGALRRDEELRHLIIQKIYKAIDSSSALSLYHHTHIAAEAIVLLDLISELQACCLVDKLFVLTKRSPLTTMEVRRTDDLFVEPSSSPTAIKQGGRWGSRDDSSFSLRLSRASSSRNPNLTGQTSVSFTSPIYNAAYEMSIGTQFVEMMLKLSSPSICRSKLAFAAFCYLREMQRGQLPWQQNQGRKVTLTRKGRNTERSQLLKKGSSDISFGIDSDDIDYFAEDFTVADLEKAVYQAFSDALGPVDEMSNLQLLLYEAAVDVLPNFVKQSGNLKLVDINDAQLFHHSTPALDIYQSIHDRVQNKGASSLYANMSNHHPKSKAQSSPEQDQKAPSHLLQYGLTYFCYSLTVAFASAVSFSLPHCSVSLLEVSLLLANHLDCSEDDIIAYRKKIFLTACRIGSLESSISHGQILLECLLNRDNSWREVLFVADNLSRQLCLNAQYELAVQLHFRILHFIRSLRLPCLSKDLAASQRVPQELLRFIDNFTILLAKHYLDFGCPDKAASVLHKLLMKVSERPLSLRSDQEKVAILSYAAEAYLQMRDFESCNRIVRAVKIVRQQRIQLLMDKYFFLEDTNTERAAKPNVQSLHFLDYISQAGSSSSHHSMSAYFRSSSVDRPNNRPLQASSASQNDEKGTPTDSDAELLASMPSPDNLPDSVFPEDKPQYSQVVRCLINNGDAILPGHCVSHHNVDLGYMLAKIYFESKLFLSALNSLIPTVLGCELLVGGKSGGKAGIHELGTLYYFRGLIQLEACRSSSELKYPCEVGSSQLFTAIQSISACVPPVCTVITNKRCFLPPKDLRAEAINKFEALHASVGDVRNVPKVAFTCRRSVTYNSPSDMLWDAMKWFRRAWDFFHTAGDDVNAARAANRIAECHLLPLFTQSALLNVPVDVARDLSSHESINRFPQPANLNNLKLNREPFTKSSERLLSPLPPLAPAPQHSPLGRSSSWMDGPTSQTAKAVVKRYASLEEVERVTSFALDTHLEASLPIEIMESYLNFAELSCLQGNMNEAFPFWWETKDLFCYLFADGCLVPIIRRCTYDFLVKIENILDRIVRFLWKLDQQIRNNHLFLLEMHVIFSVEKSRVMKAQARRARQCNKSLASALRICLVAPNVQTVNRVPSGKAAKMTPLQRAISMTKTAANPAETSQSGERLADGRSEQTARQGGIFQILRDVFSCTSYQPASAVRAPPEQQRPQVLVSSNSMWRRNLFATAPADMATTHALLSLADFESEIQQAVGTSSKNYSDIFISCVEDKVLDFGWSRFVDYDEMETAMRSSMSKSKSSEEKKDFRINLSINIPTAMLTRTLRYINVPTVLSKYILSRQDILDGGTASLEGGVNGAQRRPSGTGSRKQSPSTRYSHGQQSPSLQQMIAAPVRDHQPLDPYEDFHWMDDSFSPYYISSPLSSHRVRHELFLSESVVLCHTPDERISARTKELMCEKALIQRVWSYFLKISNAYTQSHTRYRGSSVASLNKVVRQSLSKVYQAMMRIRAFSRQFKSSMVDFHQLSDMLHNVPDFSDDPRINASNNTSAYLSAFKVQRFTMASKAVRLQERLTRMVYAVYINDVVMVYHPESGKDVVRRLGVGNKFGPLADKSNESPKSDVGSPASHFPFTSPEHASPIASGIASIVQRADESQMNMQQTALIFDYCVQDDDALCGGGVIDRQITLNSFRSGTLSHLVQFFETSSSYNPTFLSDNNSVGTAKDSNKSNVSHLSLDSKQSIAPDTSGVMSSTVSAGTAGSARSETRSLPHNHSSFFSASILGSIYFGDSMLMRNTGDRGGATSISSSSTSPPECPVPLSLICSYSLYSLPWEALMTSGTAVRSLCVLSSLAQVLGPRPCYLEDSGEETLQQSPAPKSEPVPLARKLSERFRPRRNTDDSSDSGAGSQAIAAGVNKGLLRGFLGPAWHQKPYFVSFCWDQQGLPGRFTREFQQRSQQRRAKTVLQHIRGLGHKYEHILRSRQYRGLADIGGPSISLSLGRDEKAPRNVQEKHLQMSVILKSGVYPTSSLLSDKLPPSMFDTSNFIAMNLGSVDFRTSPVEFWSQLDKRLTSQRRRSLTGKGRKGIDELSDHKGDARESFFPVILLSYCDLLEMSEAILFMQCMHRRDSIFVFAPHFIQEKLLVEMKISLDRWCRADKIKTQSTYSNASSSSANSMQSSRGLPGRANSLNNSQSLAISSSSMSGFNSVKPGSAEVSDHAKYLLTVSSYSMAADSLAASVSIDNNSPLGRKQSYLDNNSSFMSTAESEVFAHLPTQSLSIDPSELAPSNKAVIIPKAPAAFTASFFTAPPPNRPPSGASPPLVLLPPLPTSLGSSSNATISSFGNSSRESDASAPKASIFMPDLAQSLRIPGKPLALPPLPLLPPLPSSAHSYSSDMPASSRSQVPPLPPLPLPRSIVKAEGIVGLAESAAASAPLTLPTDEILMEGHSSRSRSGELEDSSNPPSSGINLSGSSSPPQRKTNSFKSKERTWVYHALMDAVQRTQKDHAVSIAVFI